MQATIGGPSPVVDSEHISFPRVLQGSPRPSQFSTVNNTILNQVIPHAGQLKNTKYKYKINFSHNQSKNRHQYIYL